MLQVHHHFLHQFIGGGAAFHVLLMHVHVIRYFFGEVGKPGTIGRPHFINITGVVFEIEELAGFCFIQPVTIPSFFTAKPFILKRLFGHAQVCGNPFNVFRRKRGRHRFAAVGAGQAVHFLPDFGFEMVDKILQTARRFTFQFGQEAPEFTLVVPRSPEKSLQVDGS